MNKRLPYVYAFKVDDVVRIIGKGTNGRVQVYYAMLRALERNPRKRVRSVFRKLFDAHILGAKIKHEYIKCDLTDKQAYAQEKRLIAYYRKHYPGQLWNLADGGSGFPILSPDALAEMNSRKSASLLKFYSDPEARAAHGKNMRRIFRNSPEWQAKLTAIIQQVNSDPLIRARKSARQSASWKQAIAADPELLQRRAAAQRCAMANPAVRKRFSRARKRWWSDSANRERLTAIVASAMTPEVRKRAGASLSKTLTTDGPMRTRHLALIDRLAKDKDLQRRKGAKLRAWLATPEGKASRQASFTPNRREAAGRRAAERWTDPKYNERVSAKIGVGVERAHKDPIKRARIRAGLNAYWAKYRAAKEMQS